MANPTLEGFTKAKLSIGTVHQYTRGLKTFGPWLERKRYAAIHPLRTLRLPRLEAAAAQRCSLGRHAGRGFTCSRPHPLLELSELLRLAQVL